MRLHRFYIPEKIGVQKEIVVHSADLANQLRRVFRLRTGDSAILFDGSGSDHECMIAGFTDGSVSFEVKDVSPSRYMPQRKVVLYTALVKKDTFEWIVEKATELGVSTIVPVMAERSEKKGLNMDRLNKIAIEAAEQSGRGDIPEIGQVVDLGGATSGGGTSYRIALHTEGDIIRRVDLRGDEVSIFIGPEGGWSPKEIEMFHASGIPVVSLGSQVLRAETAVVSALSIILLA